MSPCNEAATNERCRLLELSVNALREIIDEREKAASAALTLREENLKIHLEHLNAIRDQALEDRAEFMKTTFYETKHEVLTQRIRLMETALMQRIGAVELFQARLVGIAIVLGLASGGVGAVIGHLWR